MVHATKEVCETFKETTIIMIPKDFELCGLINRPGVAWVIYFVIHLFNE